jgi:hypothetical protein
MKYQNIQRTDFDSAAGETFGLKAEARPGGQFLRQRETITVCHQSEHNRPIHKAPDLFAAWLPRALQSDHRQQAPWLQNSGSGHDCQDYRNCDDRKGNQGDGPGNSGRMISITINTAATKVKS